MVSTLRELRLEYVLFEPCASIRQSKAAFEIARFDGKNYLLWAEQMQSIPKHFSDGASAVRAMPKIRGCF
ncbi:unnamed protein product [Prunus armeniaca]|uniref:Uncharacterized protein n=1 Tax=Prunus armeniaca TaxID=36596 RepID=A0A6J5WJZ0_PRUAR|nr:unnamed protein product [Prunus armeniaca]